jgi:hypothetical protein
MPRDADLRANTCEDGRATNTCGVCTCYLVPNSAHRVRSSAKYISPREQRERCSGLSMLCSRELGEYVKLGAAEVLSAPAVLLQKIVHLYAKYAIRNGYTLSDCVKLHSIKLCHCNATVSTDLQNAPLYLPNGLRLILRPKANISFPPTALAVSQSASVTIVCSF